MKILDELQVTETRTTIYVETDDREEAIAEGKMRGTVVECYPGRGNDDPDGSLWVVVIESEDE